ncbi:rho GTPase-activating protein 20, partial [Trichonephila clavata]
AVQSQQTRSFVFPEETSMGDDNFRVFIMESPVHFTMGVQKQDRHLFLFNDLLLVAKTKSIKSPATSFVIGWPTTNVVVTFSSLKTKTCGNRSSY